MLFTPTPPLQQQGAVWHAPCRLSAQGAVVRRSVRPSNPADSEADSEAARRRVVALPERFGRLTAVPPPAAGLRSSIWVSTAVFRRLASARDNLKALELVRPLL